MKTFKTHNTDDSLSANMTCLQGYLDIPKHKLVSFFGDPIEKFGEKVINEWVLEVTNEDGEAEIVTIYDWKNCVWDLDEDFCDWHVGGHNPIAVRTIQELIKQLEG